MGERGGVFTEQVIHGAAEGVGGSATVGAPVGFVFESDAEGVTGEGDIEIDPGDIDIVLKRRGLVVEVPDGHLRVAESEIQAVVAAHIFCDGKGQAELELHIRSGFIYRAAEGYAAGIV